MELESMNLPEQVQSTSTLKEHIFASTRKIQALVRKDRNDLQDISLLHKLAQREFGPLATGHCGLNDLQIETLENLVTTSGNPAYLKPDFGSSLGIWAFAREEKKWGVSADHGDYFVERKIRTQVQQG
jgi:hypothetical protein